MQPKFDFYEIVLCREGCGAEAGPEREGAVLGRAMNDRGEWGFAVYVYDEDEVIDFEEAELRSTGRKDRRENFYDGTVLRVRVDPETGEGSPAS